MVKKFNKGEWSEFYAFIKMLSDKKVYLFDKNLEKLDFFYKIIKVLRKEKSIATYNLVDNEIIKKKINDKKIKIETRKIKPFVNRLLKLLKNSNGSSFEIKDVDNIFKLIKSEVIKGGTSYNKADINLVINDNNKFEQDIGFNIKSYIGSPPTLLNSSRATNFVYEINGFKGSVERVNNINTKSKIRDRILYLLNHSKSITFIKLDNKIFTDNLRLIDSLLPEIISIFLLNFFSGKGRKINTVFKTLPKNKLDVSKENFEYKIKSFLLNVALGFVPTKKWDGYNKANGYIVVKNDGEIGCFDVFDKKILADYLFSNTKFDTPSSSRHKINMDMFMKRKESFILN